MKKKRGVQIFAILALLGIIISIIGTGILILTAPDPQPTLTQDELQKILQNSQVEVNAETPNGVTVESTDIEVDTDTSDENNEGLDSVGIGTGETE